MQRNVQGSRNQDKELLAFVKINSGRFAGVLRYIILRYLPDLPMEAAAAAGLAPFAPRCDSRFNIIITIHRLWSTNDEWWWSFICYACLDVCKVSFGRKENILTRVLVHSILQYKRYGQNLQGPSRFRCVLLLLGGTCDNVNQKKRKQLEMEIQSQHSFAPI